MFTILVVDDEEMVLGLCKCVLAGFSSLHVLSATCGREALKVADRYGAAVNVLLTDICLPGEMDGVGLAEKMEEVQPGVTVILMSGYACNHFSLRSTWRFLPKPFSTGELVATVQEAMGAPCRLPVVDAVVNQDRCPPPERKRRRPALSGSAT